MDIANERWLDVNGYDDKYQISNQGRLRNGRGRILRPGDNGCGYKKITLKNNGVPKHVYIHRLVAAHFVPNPLGKPCVNHLDYNRSNNAADNLEWCTSAENTKHSLGNMRKEHCYPPSMTGEKYITVRWITDETFCYRVRIPTMKIDKRFPTLGQAVCYRDGVIS